jgi:hypothetical protein
VPLVGRTSAGRAPDEETLTTAVSASICHRHTEYDQLLMRRYDRMDARDAVRKETDSACKQSFALASAHRTCRLIWLVLLRCKLRKNAVWHSAQDLGNVGPI